jgi:Flp pilus assembly pilin Flp
MTAKEACTKQRSSDGFAHHRQNAQGLAEYALIIALVAVMALAILISYGSAISNSLSKIGGSV